jgi:hypothetical protein
VDDNRPLQLARQPDLPAKHLLLHVARREVVVVVEADLADGTRRRRRRELLAHDRDGALRIVRKLMRLVRVHADRESRVGPELFEASRLPRFRRIAAFEDHEDALDAGISGARDDLVEILREGLVREVTMRINHEPMVAQ